jgi:hypothetical protein
MLGKRSAVGTFVSAAGLVIAPASGSPAAAGTTTGTSAQSNPPATVALLSPAPGNVAGSVALKAVGTIAGAQSDAGQQLEFWIDGGLASVAGCSLPSCSATCSWNTNGHGGAHTVQVQFLLRNEVARRPPCRTAPERPRSTACRAGSGPC